MPIVIPDDALISAALGEPGGISTVAISEESPNTESVTPPRSIPAKRSPSDQLQKLSAGRRRRKRRQHKQTVGASVAIIALAFTMALVGTYALPNQAAAGDYYSLAGSDDYETAIEYEEYTPDEPVTVEVLERWQCSYSNSVFTGTNATIERHDYPEPETFVFNSNGTLQGQLGVSVRSITGRWKLESDNSISAVTEAGNWHTVDSLSESEVRVAQPFDNSFAGWAALGDGVVMTEYWDCTREIVSGSILPDIDAALEIDEPASHPTTNTVPANQPAPAPSPTYTPAPAPVYVPIPPRYAPAPPPEYSPAPLPAQCSQPGWTVFYDQSLPHGWGCRPPEPTGDEYMPNCIGYDGVTWNGSYWRCFNH